MSDKLELTVRFIFEKGFKIMAIMDGPIPQIGYGEHTMAEALEDLQQKVFLEWSKR